MLKAPKQVLTHSSWEGRACSKELRFPPRLCTAKQNSCQGTGCRALSNFSLNQSERTDHRAPDAAPGSWEQLILKNPEQNLCSAHLLGSPPTFLLSTARPSHTALPSIVKLLPAWMAPNRQGTACLHPNTAIFPRLLLRCHQASAQKRLWLPSQGPD